MPRVLEEYLPAGLRGLVIAGLLAAFMSTFSSTVNSGASYIVRDIWQPVFRPVADERHLVRYSYISSVGVVVVGVRHRISGRVHLSDLGMDHDGAGRRGDHSQRLEMVLVAAQWLGLCSRGVRRHCRFADHSVFTGEDTGI